MTLFVTGATGYIGARVTALARAEGKPILAGTRRAPKDGTEWLPFDLQSDAPINLPEHVTAVIHLAANTDHTTLDPAAEIAATERLLKASKTIGARMIFVSSQTARADAPTAYGRSKWQIEQIVTTAGGISIRPGQVYGGPRRGLFGTLSNLAQAMPILPGFWPAPQIQPIHVDDLALTLLRATKAPPDRSVLCVGSDETVSFTEFLRAICRYRLGRWRLFLPVPVALVRLANRLFGSKLPALNRLNSLFDLPVMNSKADLQTLGLQLRPLSAGMTRSGRATRPLLTEGQALLRYVLRQNPPVSALKRYVRAIQSLRDGTPLSLPHLCEVRPGLIALIDAPASPRNEFDAELRWRLNAASALAEATIPGSDRFLGARPGWLFGFLGTGRAVFSEIGWRLLRFIAKPVLCRHRTGRGAPR